MEDSLRSGEPCLGEPDFRPTVLLLWLGYVGYYLGRANLALALPVLLKQYDIPYTLAGAVATAGYVCYAVGQPVHGMLIDRFGAKPFFLLGLAVSAVANLAIGCMSAPVWIAVLWGINGFFQACGWPALVKVADAWLPARGRGRLMSVLATSAHVGSVLSWAVASLMVIRFGWRYVFWVPALAVGLVWVVSLLFLRERPARPSVAEEPSEKEVLPFAQQVVQIVGNPQIRWTAFILACVNLIYNAVLAWLPTYLMDAGLALANVGWRSVAFPVTNAMGALLVGRLLDARGNGRQTGVLVLVQAGLALALSGLLLAQPSSIWALVSLAMVGLCIAGANFLVTGPIPLMISMGSSQGFTVGIINGFGYVGASLGSFLTGWLVQTSGWSSALRLWLVVALMAWAGAVRCCRSMTQRQITYGGVV